MGLAHGKWCAVGLKGKERTVEGGQLLQLQALVLVARLVRGHQQLLYHLRGRVHLRQAAATTSAPQLPYRCSLRPAKVTAPALLSAF